MSLFELGDHDLKERLLCVTIRDVLRWLRVNLLEVDFPLDVIATNFEWNFHGLASFWCLVYNRSCPGLFPCSFSSAEPLPFHLQDLTWDFDRPLIISSESKPNSYYINNLLRLKPLAVPQGEQAFQVLVPNTALSSSGLIVHAPTSKVFSSPSRWLQNITGDHG